jgi:hypothetical protein
MATTEAPQTPQSDAEILKNSWLDRLAGLVDAVETWAKELDWSTRRIDKKMKDSEIGAYRAPALIMQKETTRVLMEPIARSTPGADGVVDLYLMPAYDDIANLYYFDGEWKLHYMFPGTANVASIDHAESLKLTKEALNQVLEEMIQNVEQDS